MTEKMTALEWAMVGLGPPKPVREMIATVREAGFSDRDIWDIANVAGFFNMTNRAAAATDMQPNQAYHPHAR